MTDDDAAMQAKIAALAGQINRHKQQQSAALRSWELTKDRTARTTNGRIAAEKRFERLVDPDGVMTPAERQKAAQEAREMVDH